MRRRFGRTDRAARAGVPREPTDERESLERHWFRRLTPDAALAPLVTGADLADEPFHRWLPYKQAFSPDLVRRFLAQACPRAAAPDAPLLDPFAGSGTLPIECARRAVPALGVEALPVLAFLASARSARGTTALPDVTGAASWREVADRFVEPLPRAALILAVARQHASDGRPLAHPPALSAALDEVGRLMQEDLRRPLPLPVRVEAGDARDLRGVADGSVGGILTSPPYLSRHDYARQTRPLEEVYAHWYAVPAEPGRDAQIRAHPRAHARSWSAPPPPAAAEACEALRSAGEPKLAGIVRSYFEDLRAALREVARVLRRGAACWMVVGGARVKGIYVPADLLMAELARECGLSVEDLRVARRLTAAGRKLGRLDDVAPRESVIGLRAG